MNAAIRDRGALAALDPNEVSAYLQGTGWAVTRQEAGKYAYWEKSPDGGEPFEVLLPIDRGYRDYAQRMGELVDALGAAERRSQLDLYRDLTTAGDDLIRVRLKGKESGDGTLPIDQGVDLITYTYRVVLAGATAAARPNQSFVSKPPPAADEYVRSKVRLGQTEIGSYVVTVLSRVTPELAGDGPAAAPPFERQATTTLAVALDRTRAAAEDAVTSRRMDLFERGVSDGVTANLCLALADLAPNTSSHDGVSVEFTWARTRPLRSGGVPSAVFIPPTAFGAIREAGEKLKAFKPWSAASISGLVVRLEWVEADRRDVATVKATIDGRQRNVRVTVPTVHRSVVIAAFQDRTPIKCQGDIVRDRQELVMADPTFISPGL